MSPELMRVVLYLLALATGVLLGRLFTMAAENGELRAKLRRSKQVEKADVEKAGFTQLTLTEEGYVKLAVSPGLPPGTSLEALVFTPAQADQLVEAIGRLRRASASRSLTWATKPNKPMVN